MSMLSRRYLFCLGTCLMACAAFGQKPRTDPFLEGLLRKYPAYFEDVLRNRDSLGIQVIYTQIDRDRDNKPAFTDYYFNEDESRYFYPASTVKLPVALMAMERLRELRVPGIDRNTTLITDTAYLGQTLTINDPTSQDGRPTIGQYVKEIFLTSDNEAFNRLYEWLGSGYINARLHAMGYADGQIRHRLDVALTEDQNRRANPGRFLDYSGRAILSWPMRTDSTVYERRSDKVDGVDFSIKNRLSLGDLHQLLRSVIFPGSVSQRQRWDIDPEGYQFLYKMMSEVPGNTRWPAYDSSEVWDAYVKYLLYGGSKGPVPPSLAALHPGDIRIFNKIGQAYGFLIDVAYIVDLKKGVEFMLSAVVRCNPDRRLGDENYTYDETGFPFMQHLGEVIYQFECARPRKYRPDLSALRCVYDR